jgi:3-mercaptopyruvate sulfurtransferase SseA
MTLTATRSPAFRAHGLAALLALLALVTGCGGEDSIPDSLSGAVAVKSQTPAEIAQGSAEDYNANLSGLVTGATLRRWVSNWPRERPAGVTGNLIILQASPGPSGRRFIRPDNVDVFTYVEAGWQETRSSGVTEVATSGLSGPSLDRLSATYGIDVARDFIVCAQGGAGDDAIFHQALCWHTLRYWGVDGARLALLDGNNPNLAGGWAGSEFTDADFVPALPGQPSPVNEIRQREVGSVRNLRTNNTGLHATLGDVIDSLPRQDGNERGDGVFLWDARTVEEFSAGEATEAALPAVRPLGNRLESLRNQASRQSRPRGALQLHWEHLLDRTTGRFRPRAELAALLNGRADAGRIGFIDGRYALVGEGNAYQRGDLVIVWSETSAKAAVAAFVSGAILDYPTRLYEAGMIEWNSLTGGAVDRDGMLLLPATSRWRTDGLSAAVLANQPPGIAPRNAWSDPANPRVAAATPTQPRIVAPDAPRSDARVQADRAFGRAPEDGNVPPPSGSGRPLLPPNPCGGG